MKKYVFLAEKESIPSYQIAEPIYILDLIALIIAIIFCFFLFRIIWSCIGPPRSIKDSNALVILLTPSSSLQSEYSYPYTRLRMTILKRYFLQYYFKYDKMAIFSIFDSPILIEFLFPKGVVDGGRIYEMQPLW